MPLFQTNSSGIADAGRPAWAGGSGDCRQGHAVVVMTSSAAAGLAIARQFRWAAVQVYAADWREVDRARAEVEVSGLGDRVRIRHRAAMVGGAGTAAAGPDARPCGRS